MCFQPENLRKHEKTNNQVKLRGFLLVENFHLTFYLSKNKNYVSKIAFAKIYEILKKPVNKAKTANFKDHIFHKKVIF